MRWIWALAIACIVAATGVRPELEVRDAAAATGQLEQAPAKLQHVASRPELAAARGQLPRPDEVRLPSYLLPNPPAQHDGAGARALDAPSRLTSTLSRLIPAARTARGPPAAIA